MDSYSGPKPVVLMLAPKQLECLRIILKLHCDAGEREPQFQDTQAVMYRLLNPVIQRLLYQVVAKESILQRQIKKNKAAKWKLEPPKAALLSEILKPFHAQNQLIANMIMSINDQMWR